MHHHNESTFHLKGDTMSNHLFNIFPNERYMDLTLYQYGWEQCVPAHSYGPASRNHYLFHYIIKGRGVLYSTDDQGQTHIYNLKPDQGFLISPNQVNTYIADRENPWEYAWVEFDGLRVKEFLETSGLTTQSPIYRSSNRELQGRMKDELLTIIHGKDHSSLYLIGHLYLFLDLMIQSSFNHKEFSTGKLKDFYIREAISFIEQNYSHPITVEDIAVFCNLNRSYLGKIFRDELNKTPQQFLIYYRMNRAAELLKFSETSVGEIGKLVGYPNQLHFSRAFKNVFGTPPTEWRKENRLYQPMKEA